LNCIGFLTLHFIQELGILDYHIELFQVISLNKIIGYLTERGSYGSERCIKLELRVNAENNCKPDDRGALQRTKLIKTGWYESVIQVILKILDHHKEALYFYVIRK
jgi:hypothetical protein